MKIKCKKCGEEIEYEQGIKFKVLEHAVLKHDDQESRYLLERFSEIEGQ